MKTNNQQTKKPNTVLSGMQHAHVADRLKQIKSKKKSNKQKNRRKQKQNIKNKTPTKKREQQTQNKTILHPLARTQKPSSSSLVTNRVGEFPTSKILDQSDSCIFAQDGGAHLRLQNVRIGTSNGKQSLKNFVIVKTKKYG